MKKETAKLNNVTLAFTKCQRFDTYNSHVPATLWDYHDADGNLVGMKVSMGSVWFVDDDYNQYVTFVHKARNGQLTPVWKFARDAKAGDKVVVNANVKETRDAELHNGEHLPNRTVLTYVKLK